MSEQPDYQYGEPIVVVIQGGRVEGVYSRNGSAQPVVIIDYDDADSDIATPVPQSHGLTERAWVSDYCPGKLSPIVAKFIDKFLQGERD